MKITTLSPLSALLTAALLCGAASSRAPAAQEAPRESAAATASEDGPQLRLVILEGEGAVNNVKRRAAREPVVKVVDENDRPIAGAVVTFTLPGRGASGVFANGARSMTLMSNPQGIATATGLTPNSVAGPVSIQVSASYQGQAVSTTIAQTNAAVAGGAGISGATLGIIGAVAAGAAVAAVAATGGSDGGGPGPATRPSGTASINVGGVRIGAPR